LRPLLLLHTYGYGSIPIDTFLVGWTSIYQLFWGSLGTRVLTHPHIHTGQSSELVSKSALPWPQLVLVPAVEGLLHQFHAQLPPVLLTMLEGSWWGSINGLPWSTMVHHGPPWSAILMHFVSFLCLFNTPKSPVHLLRNRFCHALCLGNCLQSS